MKDRRWCDIEAKYAAYRAAWMEHLDIQEFKRRFLNEWTIPIEPERITHASD